MALLLFFGFHLLSSLALALPVPPVGTASGAVGVLARVFSRSDFSVVLDPTASCATVSGGSPTLRVKARTAVDAVAAVAQYAREQFNASFSWAHTGGSTLGSIQPAGAAWPQPAGGSFSLCRAVPWTYYQNVVQSSYSNVWWNASRWQTEVDWMALHGVNIALAYAGQEALFRQVYMELGLTDADLGAFFNGPAFLSWSRGQGMAGVGGPLPQWWYSSQLTLNEAVVGMMNSVGVAPILPVFQGNVPASLSPLYPQANISDGWLDVFDPLFTKIQDSYMAKLLSAYPNATCFYEGDGLFSSGTPPWADGGSLGGPLAQLDGAAGLTPNPDALKRATAAYNSFAKHDPDAVWVYQSWIWRGFQSDADLAYLAGWLAGAPQGRFFLLDQTAERVPIWTKFGNFSFFGQPFAWLSMNNMGGNVGLTGALEWVANGIDAAVEGSNGALVGIGMDPEGIDTMPMYWDFVLATTWGRGTGGSLGVAPADWLADYGVRRCGHEDSRVREAYSALHETVFNPLQPNFEHHLVYCGTAYPLRGGGNSWDKETDMIRPIFPSSALANAWSLLLAAAPTCAPPVTYDLIDVAREYLSLFPCVAAHDALNNATSLGAVAAANASVVGVLNDLDGLLGSALGFLTGTFIRDARALGVAAGATQSDLDLLEWNARSQISTWFPTPPTPSNHLYDYANKQWSGITRDYYLPRYTLLAARIEDAIRSFGKVNASAFADDLGDLGAAWTTATSPTYPAEPVGDAVALARAAYEKYAG